MSRLPSLTFLQNHFDDAPALLEAYELECLEVLEHGRPDHRGPEALRVSMKRKLARIAAHRAALGFAA
jgi:hypothetical protein